MERITISIDRDTLRRIKRVAGPRGVSKFLVEAAKQELARTDVIALLDELDEKYGRATPEQREAIYADMRKIFGL